MTNMFTDIFKRLPSPPLSPLCNDDYNIEQCICNERELKSYEVPLQSPVESSIQISQDDILKTKYMEMMEEGIETSECNEKVPYSYAIEKLHNIGNRVINKQTKDACLLRVYETGKDTYEDFWVHPIFLSTQSYQFFKLFEEVKANQEKGIIEIEIPSLKAFVFVLYYLYTGDLSKLLEIAKLDESYCKGIMENIQCLEVNMTRF